MTDLILIHGAWHGGWMFQRLRPRLEAAGLRVHTPTLSGLGARGHLLGATISLETHVQDVLAYAEFEGLERYVLAGHSYAGIVATLAACRAPDRVKGLIYLDGFVPEPGQSLLDCLAPEDRLLFLALAGAQPEPWKLPPLPPQMYGILDPELQAFAQARLTPMNLLCFMAQAHYDLTVWRGFNRAYIGALPAPGPDRFAPFRDRAARDPDFALHTLEAGHDFALTHPEAAAEALLRILDGFA